MGKRIFQLVYIACYLLLISGLFILITQGKIDNGLFGSFASLFMFTFLLQYVIYGSLKLFFVFENNNKV